MDVDQFFSTLQSDRRSDPIIIDLFYAVNMHAHEHEHTLTDSFLPPSPLAFRQSSWPFCSYFCLHVQNNNETKLYLISLTWFGKLIFFAN